MQKNLEENLRYLLVWNMLTNCSGFMQLFKEGQQKKIVYVASKIVRFLLREATIAGMYKVLVGLAIGAV